MSPGEFRSAARTVRARGHNLSPCGKGVQVLPVLRFYSWYLTVRNRLLETESSFKIYGTVCKTVIASCRFCLGFMKKAGISVSIHSGLV